MKINITDHDTFGILLKVGKVYDEEAHVLLSGEYDHLISIVDSPLPGKQEAEPPPCGWEFWNLLAEGMKLRLVFDDVQKDLPKMRRYAPTEAHVTQIIEFARTATNDTRMIVHCAAGVSRSSATALVYLSTRGVLQGRPSSSALRRRSGSTRTGTSSPWGTSSWAWAGSFFVHGISSGARVSDAGSRRKGIMPGPNVTLLLEVCTDGCTYTSEHALMAFEDESVAALVAGELNDRLGNNYRSFEILKIPTSQANEEGSVAGLVEGLITKYNLARE